jgi:hypothetical protein
MRQVLKHTCTSDLSCVSRILFRGEVLECEMEELCLHFLSTANQVARKFPRRMEPDEVALYYLVEAIYEIPNLYDCEKELGAYIYSYLHGHMLNWYFENHVVVVPHSSRTGESTRIIPEQVDPPNRPNWPIELREIISLIPESEFQSKILTLRLEGRDDVEIAGILHCSQQWVNKQRKYLQKRYVQLNAQAI